MDKDYPVQYTISFGQVRGEIAAFWGFTHRGRAFGAKIAAPDRKTLLERIDADVKEAYKGAKEMLGDES